MRQSSVTFGAALGKQRSVMLKEVVRLVKANEMMMITDTYRFV